MTIFISTEFPDALLYLATTSTSRIEALPGGRVGVSGQIALTLLGTMRSTVTLSSRGMVLGALDTGTGKHPLEAIDALELAPKKSKITTHGPSLFVRKWTIAKQPRQPAVIKLKRYAIWLSDQDLGPAVPDSDTFQLLHPSTDQGGTWAYSDQQARLSMSDQGKWMFEVLAMLVYRNTGNVAIDFELPVIMANQPVKLFLNSRNAPNTRLRLMLDKGGEIEGLLIESPYTRSGIHPLQLAIPRDSGLRMECLPALGKDRAPVERIWIAGGHCQANLSQHVRVEFGFGQCARLSGAGSAFSFNVSLPPSSHWTGQIKRAHIEASTLGISSVHASTQFDGLRISSLNSTGRKDEVLDSVGPRITLELGRGNTAQNLLSFTQDWLGPREAQLGHDGLVSTLDLPIKAALLRVVRGAGQGNGTDSPLYYQTRMPAASRRWVGELQLRTPTMLLPPLASTAQLADRPTSMTQGSTRSDYLVKHLPNSRRVRAAHRDAAPQLELDVDWFKQWELDKRNSLRLHKLGELQVRFESLEFKQATTAGGLAQQRADGLDYAALSIVLSYMVRGYRGSDWSNLFESALRVELDEVTLSQWVEVSGLENLLFIAEVLKSDAAQQDWLKRFVVLNVGQEDHAQLSNILWPFAPALGIPLYLAGEQGQSEWVWQVGRTGPAPACKLAFDFSTTSRIDPQRMGLNSDFFETEPSARRYLWPRSRARSSSGLVASTEGSVTDPAIPEWQGVFFADMPLAICIDAAPTTLLAYLRDRINAGLRLHYGWLDAGGPTWVAEWTPDASGSRLYPPADVTTPMCELYLDGFETTGSQGQLTSASLRIRLRLNRIEEQTSQGVKPVELDGHGDFKMLAGESSKFVATPRSRSAFSTSSLPGFDKLSLLRLETDFHTASVDVTLIPSPALVSLIPYFDQQEIEARVSIPVTTEGRFNLAARLPAEAPTRLFEKWPIALRGFEFVFGEDATVPSMTRFLFVLDLGIPYVKRVGGRLTVKHELDQNGKVQLGMQLDFDEFEIELPLLGLTLRGMLQWRDPGHVPSRNYSSRVELLTSPAKRDLYAYVSLDGLVQASRQDFYLRVSSAARPFWVATLLNRAGSRVAGAKIDDAGLLLAYGAQSKSNNELARVIANPEVLGRALFPAESDDPVDWLDNWEPAASAQAATVGLMGSFGLDPVIASADGNDNLTLVWSNIGLFYGQAALKVLTQVEAKLRLLIDFRRQLLTASLQLAASNLGRGVQVSPGRLSVTLSWGATKGIGMSLGFPPLMNDPLGGGQVPDWSQAISVRLASAWPINTFQGGLKAYYFSEPKVSFGFGVAIRAGYSNSFKVTGSDIADARADVGVMVGGTFEFCHGPAAAQPLRLPSLAATTDSEAWLRDELERLALGTTRGDPLRISAMIIGDVWGHASVVFLGVTIAGVNIDARAKFTTRGTFDEGIMYMSASFYFNVSVKIGCSTYGTKCRFDVDMITKDMMPAGSCTPLLQELRERALTLDEILQ